MKKNNTKYQLINAAVYINKIIIKNTNLSPLINNFSEKFTKIIIDNYINFLSDYNQIKLIKKNRDIIIIIITYKLFRQTTLF